MNVKWKASEKEYVRLNCVRFTDQNLADQLTLLTGRKISLHAVRKVRQEMGLKKIPGRGVCGIDSGRSK